MTCKPLLLKYRLEKIWIPIIFPEGMKQSPCLVKSWPPPPPPQSSFKIYVYERDEGIDIVIVKNQTLI